MDHTLDALTYVTKLKGAFMGCDIHWHSETKKDGQWECDQAASFAIEDEGTPDAYVSMDDFPDRGRDYWLFGLLQPGVRSTWDWSFPERDAPDDLSSEVKQRIESYGQDGHSHGYVTRAELQAKLEELRIKRAEHLIMPSSDTEALHHHISRINQLLSDLNADVPDTDQRIVFWFDN